MKKIIISDDRKLNISNIVVGYLQENKIEKLEFEIPKEYENFGRKACFDANGNTFVKTFDNITGNTITLTRDITQYQDLFMTIVFFKIEDEDEIIARTSTLHILIQGAVICDDDIKPDDPKVVILDNLITKVTNLDNTVTKNEEIREANETTRQQNETTREENEINRVNSEDNREKAEESRKKSELERVSNETTRQSNEEERKAAENERVSNENAREEYINNLKAQVENGDFDGADFNYKWDGTKLGVKNSKETTYQFVELKGQKGDKGNKGDKGDTGNGIQNIEKVSTVGNVDTYAINYTDGTQTTFDVTNGEVTKEQLDEVDNKAKNTRNELERVKNDVLETGTDTDTYIHLEDSAMAEYQELSVDGVCKQNSTSGYNQLSYPQNDINYNANNTIIKGSKGVYSIQNTPSVGTSAAYDLSKNYVIQENDYLHFLNDASSSSIILDLILSDNTRISNNFVPINKIISLSNYVGKTITKILFYISTTYDGNKINFSPMIVNNVSTLKDFEQFTGGQPSPSPDYPQEIKTIENSLKVTSCNKNLFDVNNHINAFINGNIIQNLSDGYTYYIKAKPNSTYTFRRSTLGTNNRGYIVLTNKFPKVGDEVLVVTSNVNMIEKTFNTYSDTEYILLFLNRYTTDTLGENIQLEESPTATSYEQHLETQINANLPEGEFIGKINDTYKDTLNIVYKDDGHYHLILNKMIGKIVLNGSETFYINAYAQTLGYNIFVYKGLTTSLANGDNSCKSNYFIHYSWGQFDIKDAIYQNSNWIMFKCDSLNIGNDIDKFKEWLSTHNTEVYYALATPYEVDLGIVDQLITYNEITNLFTDSDLYPVINVKYYRNFISTVRNLQVNEKALKQELIDINNRLSALETAQTSTMSESEVVE